MKHFKAAQSALCCLLFGLTVQNWAHAQSPETNTPPPEAPLGSAPTLPPSAAEPTGQAAPELRPEVAVTTAAPEPVEEKKEEAKPATPHWYELLKIRGYTQMRYNRIPTFDDNEKLVNAQGDKYIGNGSGFGIRRARVILYGDVHERVSVYLQTDFASAIDDQNHVAIVRDWYADIFLDPAKTFRFRLGQSKVPYGFENMQSSQNRLPLDRNDGINSAVKDERDLGIFFYWAPAATRALFKSLVDDNLKGSGDYGVLGLGVYNGQTANRFDNNDNLHVIGRLTFPFQLGSQILEVGGGGYTGLYKVSIDEESDFFTRDADGNIRDARAYGQLVLYPKPLGITVEVNAGVGPQMGRPGDADRNEIASRKLWGGYAQLYYMFRDVAGTVSLTPYVRGTMYEGGKKFETNAPFYKVRELEFGVEWQLIKALEITAVYAVSDRSSSKAPYDRVKGHIGRVQVQVNY
jgi:hypothetical protein